MVNFKFLYLKWTKHSVQNAERVFKLQIWDKKKKNEGKIYNLTKYFSLPKNKRELFDGDVIQRIYLIFCQEFGTPWWTLLYISAVTLSCMDSFLSLRPVAQQ